LIIFTDRLWRTERVSFAFFSVVRRADVGGGDKAQRNRMLLTVVFI